tara:strand:- start:683 stop:1324 length:642 start_codon:yes stop_codon:yes gene_type:complete
MNQDIKQSIKVVGLFFLQSYKILTGTLLTIFIPQKCEEIINNNTETSICTLEQNFNNNNTYHSQVLNWNILTMVLFFGYFMIELKREKWVIQNLEVDHDLPDNALKEILKKEPQLDKQMDKLNFYYYYILNATIISYFINVALMIKILKTDYHSTTTLSSFFSFTLLVFMKLYNSYIVAKESIKNDKMLSSFLSEFVSYNNLDPKHRSIDNKP